MRPATGTSSKLELCIRLALLPWLVACESGQPAPLPASEVERAPATTPTPAPQPDAPLELPTTAPDPAWDELNQPTSPHHAQFDLQCLSGTSRYGAGPSIGANLDRGYGFHPTPIEQQDFNFVSTAEQPDTSFAARTDVAAYSHVRQFLLDLERLPPSAAVRTEELLNAFDLDRAPKSGGALAIATEVGPCPWAPDHRLIHVRMAAKPLTQAVTPPRRLVFLIDMSGSMHCNHRLGLIKHGIASLSRRLGPDDHIAIVGYGAAEQGVVLPPTRGDDRMAILAGLDRLEQGDADARANPLAAALQLAEQPEAPTIDRRVVLITDGYLHFEGDEPQPTLDAIAAARAVGVGFSLLGVDPEPTRAAWLRSFADEAKLTHVEIPADTFAAQRAIWAEAGLELAPLAEQVEIRVHFEPTQVAEYRLVGYESVRDNDEVRPPHETGTLAAGHAMTAIYEIVPAERADEGTLMRVELSYVQPGSDARVSVAAEARTRDIALAATSTDFRFATAVVMFAESLRAAKTDVRPPYAEVLELASAALGSDPSCARHELLELIWKAGTLAGEQLAEPDTACTPAR